MIISWQELDASTLQNIIEYFVLREGTDYGKSEKSLVEKVDEVKCQLQTGKAIIVWSESHETIDIIMKECVSSF